MQRGRRYVDANTTQRTHKPQQRCVYNTGNRIQAPSVPERNRQNPVNDVTSNRSSVEHHIIPPESTGAGGVGVGAGGDGNVMPAEEWGPDKLPTFYQPHTSNNNINHNFSGVGAVGVGEGVDYTGIAVQQSLLGLSHCYNLLYMQQREIQALREQVHRMSSGGAETLNNQTLNNQVIPGMRANNYWDNFRSYSTQNLLSQPKCKPAMSPQQTQHPSHQQESNERVSGRNDAKQVNQLGARPKEGVNRRGREEVVGQSPRPRPQTQEVKIEPQQPTVQESPLPANLSAGILARDAVYGEVASLIAANESRPQFLMELFRELQSLHSDSQRIDALRSLQRIQEKQKLSAGVNEFSETKKQCVVNNLQMGAIPKLPSSPSRAHHPHPTPDHVEEVTPEPTSENFIQNNDIDDDVECEPAVECNVQHTHTQRSAYPPYVQKNYPFGLSSDQQLPVFAVPKGSVMANTFQPIQICNTDDELCEVVAGSNLDLAEADQSPGSNDNKEGSQQPDTQPPQHFQLTGQLFESHFIEDALNHNHHHTDQNVDESELGLDEIPTRLDGDDETNTM